MRRLFQSLAVVALLAVAMLWARPDPMLLAVRAQHHLTREAASWLADHAGPVSPAILPASQDTESICQEIRTLLGLGSETPSDRQEVATIGFRRIDGGGEILIRLEPAGLELRKHKTFLWTSVVPSLVAVFLALLTRNSLLALVAGLASASLLLNRGSLPESTLTAFGYLVQSLSSSFSLSIILFILGLIGSISIITASGGTRALVGLAERILRGPRSARLATALSGLLVFFDDYSNCVVVGTTMRPLTDRFRVSREKLAYLVDSTAAPLASLTVLSTWAWFEIGLMREPLQSLGLLDDPSSLVAIFWQVVPFRFYCITTLVLVFAGILVDKDFEPMARAEQRAQSQGLLLAEGSRPLVHSKLIDLRERPGVKPRLINAVGPLVVTFVGLILGFTAFSDTLSRETVIAGAAGLGSITAGTLAVGLGSLSVRETVVSWFAGARAMAFAVAILVLAWAIGKALVDLGTADYCVACIRNTSTGFLLPCLVFLLSAAVAFSTGSSWTTMALLLPTVIPIAFEMNDPSSSGGLGLTIIAMAAVLDGAIFGDHCSPLSDTTILSSAACCCDHIDHVRTQLPYATLSMVIAATLGYIPSGLGVPGWAFLGVCPVVVLLVLWKFGKRVTLPRSQLR